MKGSLADQPLATATSRSPKKGASFYGMPVPDRHHMLFTFPHEGARHPAEEQAKPASWSTVPSVTNRSKWSSPYINKLDLCWVSPGFP